MRGATGHRDLRKGLPVLTFLVPGLPDEALFLHGLAENTGLIENLRSERKENSMKLRTGRVSVILGLGLLAVSAAVATAQQPGTTTTTQTGQSQTSIELTHRERHRRQRQRQQGRRQGRHGKATEYTIPDGFKFQFEGRDIGVAELKAEALGLGFKHVESAPLVRSSYHARDQVPGAESKRARRQATIDAEGRIVPLAVCEVPGPGSGRHTGSDPEDEVGRPQHGSVGFEPIKVGPVIGASIPSSSVLSSWSSVLSRRS